MTISIDLCVNMKKTKSLTFINNYIENIAKKYDACFSFTTHELEGSGHKILKHNYIYNLTFDEKENFDIKKLIGEIKSIKIISIDNITFY